MRIKKRRHAPRVFALRVHSAGQRLNTAMHQPAIERSGHRAADRLDLAQTLEKFVIPPRDQCAAEHVAMAAKIFRGRMHDQIRAEGEWSLNDRRPCVVANQKRAGPMRDLGHRRNVGQLQRRIGWRLNPDEFRVRADRLFERDEIGQIDEIDGQLPTSQRCYPGGAGCRGTPRAARLRDR